MNNYIRDDITEYKTITYENRQIRIFVLGKKEDKFSPTISEFKAKDEEHLAVKMSRFGGE